jgi:hypothetical protein
MLSNSFVDSMWIALGKASNNFFDSVYRIAFIHNAPFRLAQSPGAIPPTLPRLSTIKNRLFYRGNQELIPNFHSTYKNNYVYIHKEADKESGL